MKRRTLSLIISGLLGVIAILSGIYLMAASVTNYIAESKKTDWRGPEAGRPDGARGGPGIWTRLTQPRISLPLKRY